MTATRLPGLKPLYRGFYLGPKDRPLFASPVFFSLAHVGLMSVSQIKKTLKQLKDVTLEDLRDIAEKRWGSTEIIDDQPVKKASVSLRGTLSMDVTSQTGNTHQITIYNPYEDSINSLMVQGGTRFYQNTLARNRHVSEGLEHDKRFLYNLRQRFGSTEDYAVSTGILDYTHAVALTYFANNSVKGKDSTRAPFLPYRFTDFSALDFLVSLEDMSLSNAEVQLIGSKILTPGMIRSYKNQKAQRGIFIEGKRWHPIATPLLQALEIHCYEQGRRFTGQYSLEFLDSKQPWTSLVFEGPRKNCHIVYDAQLPEPLIIYKYPTTKQPDKVSDPFELINDPSTRITVGTRGWVERDFWSGQLKECYMFLPDRRITKIANKFKK